MATPQPQASSATVSQSLLQSTMDMSEEQVRELFAQSIHAAIAAANLAPDEKPALGAKEVLLISMIQEGAGEKWLSEPKISKSICSTFKYYDTQSRDGVFDGKLFDVRSQDDVTLDMLGDTAVSQALDRQDMPLCSELRAELGGRLGYQVDATKAHTLLNDLVAPPTPSGGASNATLTNMPEEIFQRICEYVCTDEGQVVVTAASTLEFDATTW